jgi:hypothetical protein
MKKMSNRRNTDEFLNSEASLILEKLNEKVSTEEKLPDLFLFDNSLIKKANLISDKIIKNLRAESKQANENYINNQKNSSNDIIPYAARKNLSFLKLTSISNLGENEKTKNLKSKILFFIRNDYLIIFKFLKK